MRTSPISILATLALVTAGPAQVIDFESVPGGAPSQEATHIGRLARARHVRGRRLGDAALESRGVDAAERGPGWADLREPGPAAVGEVEGDPEQRRVLARDQGGLQFGGGPHPPRCDRASHGRARSHPRVAARDAARAVLARDRAHDRRRASSGAGGFRSLDPVLARGRRRAREPGEAARQHG